MISILWATFHIHDGNKFDILTARSRHAHPLRNSTDELSIGTTARPAVKIGRTRAPLTRVSWDARRTPAPSSPGSIHASDARRSHARAATTHAAARARPDVATVGGLHPRRLAAADLLGAGGRRGACKRRQANPEGKGFR